MLFQEILFFVFNGNAVPKLSESCYNVIQNAVEKALFCSTVISYELFCVISHARRIFPSYRNQCIDMQNDLVDWFLDDRKIAIKCHIQQAKNVLRVDNKDLNIVASFPRVNVKQ